MKTCHLGFLIIAMWYMQVILTRLRMMMNPGYPYEDGLKEFYNETNLIMCSYLPQFKVFDMSRGQISIFSANLVDLCIPQNIDSLK